MASAPSVIVLAGPNGAGKSTVAPAILRDELGLAEFVNADTIAQGRSAYNPAAVAFTAGRIMLQRLDELAASRATFAFETTLASRTFAPWIRQLQAGGYRFRLFYLWVPSPDLSILRISNRVRMGGHHVPDDTVRRRDDGSLRNFFRLYRPLADDWERLDNSAPPGRLVASGTRASTKHIGDESLWARLEAQYGYAND